MGKAKAKLGYEVNPQNCS